MGRKSRHRVGRGKNKKNCDPLENFDDPMTLMFEESSKPRNAKQTSKLNKKLRKKLRREMEYGRNSHEKKGTSTKKQGNWHTVRVTGRTSVEKHFLYTSIGSLVDVEFQPLGFHTVDTTSCFYLESNEPAATAIEGLNKRLQGSDGSLLKIVVTRNQSPTLVLNVDQLKVLKEVMSRRFNATAGLLDLTDLHHDSELIEKEILAPLASPDIMKQILRMTRENVPHLKALNLSKNRLHVRHLKLLQNLQTGNSELSALNLAHNHIGDIQILKLIKMFPLTELSLEFNPVLVSFKNDTVKYVTHVKKELPRLKLLDSVDVEAYLLENVTPKIMHEPKLNLDKTTAGSSSIKVSDDMVRTYLDQYYRLMDTQERSELVAAYTPDAVLEIKSSINSIGSSVFVGQSKICEALALLPATQHQHNTLSLDIKLPTMSAAQAIVTGQCQMAGVNDVVNFSRSMNIIPYNAGLCCSQDLLEIR